MIKKFLALFLLVLISIDSLAAVVSDSDGPAFITKAEFEELKLNFESQIDKYNASLDNKIDGAIASYLDGNHISVKQSIKQMDNYNTIRWMHGPYMYFTNRRFTEFSATEGKYVDTVKWQILKPENRRQTQSDAYAWCYDNLRDNFSNYHVAFMLWPSGGVTKQWGIAYGSSAHRYGPTIYVECEKRDGKWVLTDNTSRVIVGESGYTNYLWAQPHSRWSITNKFSWTGEKKLTSEIGNGVVTYANAASSGDIVGYTVGNIPNKDATTKTSVTSRISIAHNPNFPGTNSVNLWESANALRTACGECGYGLSASHYIDDGLVEDNRWKTQRQFQGDDNNLRYSLFGADQDDSIEVNVAPKSQYASTGNYLDLSESGNTVSYRATMGRFNIVNTVPWTNDAPHSSWYYDKGNAGGEFIITIPLFYRMKYSDLRNYAHKTLSGEYLKKGDGYPIMAEAPANGMLQLTINYEEKVDVDTTVTGTMTLDNKVKTYFKNKRFSDNTGEFYQGYKNIAGTGTKVTLNGTEWTSKKITLNIQDIKKGDAVWMRIDPLTENGIYCVMNNITAMFIEE